MRLPRLPIRPAGIAVAVAVTGALTTGTLAATGTTVAASAGYDQNHQPISADAPYDDPFTNSIYANLPTVAPAAGTDYGHLPRWKKYADGRVLLREDRVELRRLPSPGTYTYTNVNPRLRSYWLSPRAVVVVGWSNYRRITGRRVPIDGRRYTVTRRQFLDSFNTSAHPDGRYGKYASVYRLTFDRGHSTITRISDVPVGYGVS